LRSNEKEATKRIDAAHHLFGSDFFLQIRVRVGSQKITLVSEAFQRKKAGQRAPGERRGE
jgi:hypothetical protein